MAYQVFVLCVRINSMLIFQFNSDLVAPGVFMQVLAQACAKGRRCDLSVTVMYNNCAMPSCQRRICHSGRSAIQGEFYHTAGSFDDGDSCLVCSSANVSGQYGHIMSQLFCISLRHARWVFMFPIQRYARSHLHHRISTHSSVLSKSFRYIIQTPPKKNQFPR